MKTRLFLFFTLILLSVNAYGVTASCYHDGGYSPRLKNMGSYTYTDWTLDLDHAIRSQLYSMYVDEDWDIEQMISSGKTRVVELNVGGLYGTWDFDGSSMRGFYEAPIFWASPAFGAQDYCDHIFFYKEVTTTFSVSPSTTVSAGDSITVSWNGVNATYCQDTGTSGTWAASGSLPVIATEELAGSHSMVCYYTDVTGGVVHTHDSHTSPPLTLTVTPSCYISSQDVFAVAQMSTWSVNVPYEQGFVLYCISNDLDDRHHMTSFSACTDHVQCSVTQDPCELILLWSSGSSVSGAHRHPYFTSSSEYTAGVGCHKDKDPKTISQLNSLNSLNNGFGAGGGADDYAFASTRGPLYLLTPTGSNIKVLEGSTTRVVQ